MKNNIPNKYFASPKSSSKPYERKIKLNQISPKNYFTEVDIHNLEENDREIPPIKVNQIQSQKDYRYNEMDNIKGYNLTEEFKKNQTDNSDNFQNNFEYNSHGRNSRIGDYGPSQNYENQNFTEINNNNENTSSKNKNDVNYIRKNYQMKYIDGDNYDDNNNEFPKYNYKYKYKKLQKDERNIEYDDKVKGEAEQNEEEDSKEDKEKLDLQELKKKPGKILHQSVIETYDDEGNRVVTTKTIKEFSQKTGGFRMRDFHQSKERKEFERHTTNNINNKFQKYREKKVNFSYKNKLNNKKGGDRIYLLAQLAKIKNDSEKKKRHKIYSGSISPIIIHESNGYENQNSIWSHEMIDPNSFDRETYERRNYNFNYPTNYGRININKEPDYDDRCYYQSVNIRPRNINQMQEDEYFIEPKRDVTSPIGYIATYSSGSEDNEEIGISHDQYLNRIDKNNYLKTNSKSKSKSKSKSIPEYNQEGELIKRRQVTYQMEDPRNYAKNYKKKAHNLSGLEIQPQIDNSKSDYKDFQSPDREFGVGSNKFRKVTMAMISSYGPTCEDRKITRKMRSELGGVVDLRQEINPVNNYKIKKVRRFGFNLKKNPKTKLESAKIIQYWWRALKERKNIRIKILKLIKLQSVVRGFLIRNQFIKLANLCTALEIIKNLYYNHYKHDILKFLKTLKIEKIKSLLSRLINKTETKNINPKLKGYGGDKYGIIYDRKGKIIGEKEGQVKDISIQHTLNEEINNNLLRNKTLQNKIYKQKPLYIKSIMNKKEMIETGTGDGLNNILNEKITKIVNIAYKKKPKGINKISGKNYFKISKIEKHYSNQGTSMLPIFNKIVTEKRMFINNDKLNNKFYRRRDLLLQILSKSIIREKYKLHYHLTNWYKNTKKIIEQERTRNSSLNKSKIIKNENFEIINKKDKRDKSCGNIYIPNKIIRGAKIELKQKKLKKDEGVDISFPLQFKQENLKKSRINSDIYLSKKNPIILRKTRGDIFSVLDSEHKPINKEVTEKNILRKKQILTKFIKAKDKLTLESILRKYLIMWCRKTQYITLKDNAKIITDFCRAKLNQIKLVQKWKKLCKKYLLNQNQKYIMKIIKKIKYRRKKILQLMRITTLIRFYNQKTFLHKIIMYWFIYAINAAKKRKQMKMLYENMLTTYVSMADDIFGKNQKNNPSIQDFMFEIVDTNKYQVKELEDVPMAKTYYSKKKEEKKVITNIKYITRNLEDEKETNKYFYPKYNHENILLKNRINNTDAKKGNLSKAINLSFNYNDNSIFDDKNSKKNENNNFYTPNEKRNIYKDYSKTNNITNNNYSLNNSSYSNNNNNTNDYSYKYKRGNNSEYKIYNNNDTRINFNKININNNIYSDIKKDNTDNVLYKGIYGQNKNNINNYESNTNNKLVPINKYNNNQTKYNKYRNYNSNYNYINEKNKINNDDSNNNSNYYNKIKPEEKSKYISNYYRRNKINYNETGNK